MVKMRSEVKRLFTRAQMPGGHGPVSGGPAGFASEHVPSGFFVTPGIAVGVPEPAGAAVVDGGAVVAGGAVSAGGGAAVGAGAGAGAGGG
jgi:hypothetical protein